MRGGDKKMEGIFCYLSAESVVPTDHPLRPIRKMAEEALQQLSSSFEKMYSHTGRPSIAPEKLMKALLLQTLYSVKSVRMLMEQLGYNILFKWFVGLAIDDKVWDHSTFSQNQERFINSDIAKAFLEKIQEQAGKAGLLSSEHFSIDGTLIEAWASIKSFQKRDKQGPLAGSGRNDEVDFHGEKRSNETHESITDPDSRLFRKGKGKEAKLSYMGHVLMENRNGLIVDTELTLATGTAEREAAENMVENIPGSHRITVAGDKNYDTRGFVEAMREFNATPHVAQNDKNRSSAIDQRTTRHEGYAISQKYRKRIEEIFGWMKTVGNLRKIKYRGKTKVSWHFTFSAAAYNLVRMRNLGVGTA
ncbi:MAG: IS5 family transposase [Nitrospiraceae bacterium]|nr:IS5 family transposase [Nitrospiraceae bacterium]